MSRNAGFDEERIKSKCAAIEGLDFKIAECEEELRRVHEKAQEVLGKPKIVSVCACGTEISEGTKFCGKCGIKVTDTDGS